MHVIREAKINLQVPFLPGDIDMKVISQEISAVDAPMAIEDPEVSGLLPLDAVFRLGDVQDDGDPVLIVLADGALIGGGRISFD